MFEYQVRNSAIPKRKNEKKNKEKVSKGDITKIAKN